MAQSVPLDMTEIQITPFFRYEANEDINASERAGHLVTKNRIVCEMRIGGSRNYIPVVPADAVWQREGPHSITYAERFAEQFAKFMAGQEQEAAGTPLEMLKPMGISAAQLSLCRALKIYSIEALHKLEGPALKNLGMACNDLKEMAKRYLEGQTGSETDKLRIADLEAQLEAMRAVPAALPTEPEITAAVNASDAEEREKLKAAIAAKTGARPRGNPSLDTLRDMAAEVEG
jgi:hypothetical protein